MTIHIDTKRYPRRREIDKHRGTRRAVTATAQHNLFL